VKFIEVFTLDLFSFLNAECVESMSYAEKLAISLVTIVSLGVLAIIVGAVWSDTILHSSSVKNFILLIYLVLPVMSSMAVSALSCTAFDTGNGEEEQLIVMTVDMSELCYGDVGKTAKLFGWLTMAIFPIGVPLSLFILLFHHRDQIMQRQTRSGDGELGYVGELRNSRHAQKEMSPPPSTQPKMSPPTSHPPHPFSVPVSALPAQVLVPANRRHSEATGANLGPPCVQ
jgi:hypothetical protein